MNHIEYARKLRPIVELASASLDDKTASTAFAMDKCGWWKGVLYRSKQEANVYTPEQYPVGWEGGMNP